MATGASTNTTAELQQYSMLLRRAEHVVEQLVRLLPKHEAGWLKWRYKQLDRELASAERELTKLIEAVQEFDPIAREAVALEDRRKWR